GWRRDGRGVDWLAVMRPPDRNLAGESLGFQVKPLIGAALVGMLQDSAGGLADRQLSRRHTVGVERRAREILERRPETTAFFAFNDLVALGVMEALRSMGRRPGIDVSVLGFDDIFAARYTNPPLTTVRQSGYEKGALAVRRLLEVLDGDRTTRSVMLPTSLVIRESCRRIGER
ncbi:MAG: substrate-binding domain-containing protein, partial [Firmicutes bacterium]|nr:substrate-binding domain-containing protein [Bacillota bacterium]